MEEFQTGKPVERLENKNQDTGHAEGDQVEENEEAMGVPFGLLGASFLCNVLQYAVFLGLTMVVLIIIHVFMP